MPGTGAALFAIVLFVLPGFLTVRLVMGRLPTVETSDMRAIVFAVLFSTIIHFFMSIWTLALAPEFEAVYRHVDKADGQPISIDLAVVAWLGVLLFVFPIVLAELIGLLWGQRWLQPILKRYGATLTDFVPQAWDWTFLTDRGGWVVIQLKGGLLLGGEYGAKSYASLSPATPDIFIQTTYNVDQTHRFLGPIDNSAGAWVNGSAIDVLHFYRTNEAGA